MRNTGRDSLVVRLGIALTDRNVDLQLRSNSRGGGMTPEITLFASVAFERDDSRILKAWGVSLPNAISLIRGSSP